MLHLNDANRGLDMDEHFKIFVAKFGPQFGRREAPPSSIDRYRGILPDPLLKFWDEFGWSGYADGLFWVVNPQEYEGIIIDWLDGTWLEGKDRFHVFARSAFGQLFLWGEKYGQAVTIDTLDAYAITPIEFTSLPAKLDEEIRFFFLCLSKEACDFDGMFAEALSRLGRLDVDEMYSFMPALALGGPREASRLEKTGVIEHLTFLAQLDDLEMVNLPE
jgi:hypothetical protein